MCLQGEEQESTGAGTALDQGTRRQEQLLSPAAESGCTQMLESFSVLSMLGDGSGSLQEQPCHSFPAPYLLSGEREHSVEKRYITQVHQKIGRASCRERV